MTPSRAPILILLLLVGVLAGCGSTVSDPAPGPKVTPPPGARAVEQLPAAEGTLKLLAPPGYTPLGGFEQASGCQVSVTRASTTDQLVRLMSTGRFDGGLGMGDAMVRLVEAGAIAPVNTALIPAYDADVYDGLKDQPYNAVGGQMFALPVGRAADVLLYRRDKVPGTLPGLAAVLDGPQAANYGGQIVIHDDPSNIAQAALWVARQRDDLEITDPYELDRKQFDVVLGVLRRQAPYVERYWTGDAQVVADFRSGEAVLGLVSQNAAHVLSLERHPEGPYQATQPREGSSGISPAWMVAADAAHPGCMYRWLARSLEPAVQRSVFEDAHVAPSNRRVCDEAPEDSTLAARCESFSADDDGFYDSTLFRTTPSRDCGDARGRVCMDEDTWREEWARIID